MRRFSLLIFPVILAVLLPALFSRPGSPEDQTDSEFQKFTAKVAAAAPENRAGIVDSFMSAIPSFPYIEDPVAHFIYRGNAGSVNVPGDANGWSGSGYPMTRLSTTDFWYTSQPFESDARLDYKFIIDGSSWILDPRNPKTVAGGFGPNSELAMPLYVQPWEIVYNPAIGHGRLESKSVYSVFRGVTYGVKIYLPPGYDSALESYPAVYFQDGSEYINLGKSVNVIDNLIEGSAIRPLIGVFVTPTNRNEEYAGATRAQYMQFFAEELVHFVDSAYRTIPSPRYRGVIGDSYGGNISALISYNHPDLFGNCGIHSGAFQPNGYEAYYLIVNGGVKKDSLKYCSVWGTYESPLTQNMRAFRDSLVSQGYDLSWEERHEGHSWGLWRATTDLMLMNFFPLVTGADDERTVPIRAELYQNFPNPFNPATKIGYRVSSDGWVRLYVHDLLGRESVRLVDGFQRKGAYEVELNFADFPSGIYLCRLRSGGISATRKLLLVR